MKIKESISLFLPSLLFIICKILETISLEISYRYSRIKYRFMYKK